MSIAESIPDVIRAVLDEGNEARVHVTGNSMHPTLRSGDRLCVRAVVPAELRRGDIVLVRRENGMLSHRIVAFARDERGETRLITRGDNAPGCDEPVELDRLLGRVVAFERGGRVVGLTSRKRVVLDVLRSLAWRAARPFLARLHPGG